ncbi:MAG TPA: hypothetical protein VKB49_13855 [Candidatus Sulfotelmatobacter sp.]|nr:hypothetical protein [Candidatus Sulfotelmatobacter sp.]
MDTILLCAIALQWWLMGLWIQHASCLARFLKATAACVTLLGALMTFVAVPKSLAEVGMWQRHTVEIVSLLVLLAWVIMMGAGIVSLVLLGIRGLSPKRRSIV